MATKTKKVEAAHGEAEKLVAEKLWEPEQREWETVARIHAKESRKGLPSEAAIAEELIKHFGFDFMVKRDNTSGDHRQHLSREDGNLLKVTYPADREEEFTDAIEEYCESRAQEWKATRLSYFIMFSPIVTEKTRLAAIREFLKTEIEKALESVFDQCNVKYGTEMECGSAPYIVDKIMDYIEEVESEEEA